MVPRPQVVSEDQIAWIRGHQNASSLDLLQLPAELEQIQFLLGPRLSSNHRTIPRLHTTNCVSRQRQNRNRAPVRCL